MKKIKIFALIIFICLLAFGIYYVFSGTGKRDEAKGTGQKSNLEKLVGQMDGLIIKYSELQREIEVSGTILPFEETRLIPEVSGRVVNLNIQEGKSVKRGTLLVKLFDGDLQAQLKTLEVQLKIAENNEQRLKTLFDIQGTSRQEYDAGILQVSNLKAQIEILKVNISKTEIRAPFDGVLGLKNVSIGQYVTPSTEIVAIRAVSSLKLDFSLPERYSEDLKQGAKVKFTITGSDKIYEAAVVASEYSIDQQSRNLNVRAVVSGNRQGLLPGTFAKVKANLGSSKSAIMIPTSTIVPQANKKKVFIAKNGIAKSVEIKTGFRETDNIEVISGLNEGDTLIISGIMFVKPNKPVKFSNIKLAL